MGSISNVEVDLTSLTQLLMKWLHCLLAGNPGKDNLAVRPETNIGVSVNRL